ncbi:transglycosylase [Kitasatospora sp. MMS16-BH015]|uniref:LysM peptidoglycan-binding domain-containing protein n=1 Tax=Kitasatospora sp. MMS16-BH015 TaxID=2018025 RepID=UPI000CA2ECA1|nr:transglycosylase family protein [Kitasatospora sp. MMS16-BH015]AUG82149.1 transglycosylase [Kitasatospora sp. MMS16-BH015]
MTFRNETTAATTTSAKRNRLRMVLMGGAVAALPVAGLVTATSASAASTSTWDAVAQCESTGNWSINSGNGFYGGLQFTPSTWAAYGGTQYAASADQASKGQQIAIAEKVLADQGPGAWPVCSVKAGLTAGGAAAQVDTSSSAGTSTKSDKSADTSTKSAPKNDTSAASRGTERQTLTTEQSTPKADAPKAAAPKAAAPKAAEAPAKKSAPAAKSAGGNYTVKSGDTLSEIAAAHGVDLSTLYSHNAKVIGGNPDLILPGQVLSI